jgi:hypothetical protein
VVPFNLPPQVSVFSTPANYRVVKIVHFSFEVVL